MSPRLLAALIALAALPPPAGAQNSQVGSPVPRGITTLVIGMDVSNGIVASSSGSHVRVPPYEWVTLQAPPSWSYPIQWWKDGKQIPGATGTSLSLAPAVQSDSGSYVITGAPFPLIATPVALDVVPAGHTANFSSRLQLAPGSGSQTIGFVVAGKTAASFLFRAVGPSLAAFGIAQPAPAPHFRVFDSSGNQVSIVRVAIAWDWPATFATVGAFPLTGGESPGSAYDVYPLNPGAYTVQVSDDSGKGGTVLFEAYDGASLVPLGGVVSP